MGAAPALRIRSPSHLVGACACSASLLMLYGFAPTEEAAQCARITLNVAGLAEEGSVMLAARHAAMVREVRG